MAQLSVNTLLLDNTLEGARIIDMGSTKVCECFVLPREKVSEVGKHYQALHQHGFYILLGKDNKGNNMAYIGKTQNFTERVTDHKVKKEFWDTALVFVSKSNEIFDSEILYLEYLGYKAATEAGNYTIENSQDVRKNRLSPSKENEMNSFFEDIQFLTRFYGCKVFDKPEKSVVAETCYDFILHMPKYKLVANLEFYKQSKRFIIKAGSEITSKTWDSCSKSIKAFREQVLNDKLLSQKKGDTHLLLKDIELPENISSSSGSAMFCAGTSMQGPYVWRDKDGNKYPTEWWNGE